MIYRQRMYHCRHILQLNLNVRATTRRTLDVYATLRIAASNGAGAQQRHLSMIPHNLGEEKHR